MDFYYITEEDIANAKDYMPLMEKIAFVDYCAQKCFDRVEISGDEAGPLPSMYKENPHLKSRFMMGALVRYYFGKEYIPVKDDKWLMSVDDYDRWAGGHICNTIERAKSNAALRNKCFDLMQDYRDLEKRLNIEVYSILNIMNDPVSRLTLKMTSDASPEAIQEALEELKKIKAEAEELAEKKGEAN